MTFFEAIILGVIEGLTEFIPVSSTAHLIIAGKLFGLPATVFQKTFEVVIQTGSILAIVALYIKTILKHRRLIKYIALGCLPTLVVGALIYPVVKGYFFENLTLIAGALFIGGMLIIIIENRFSRKEEKVRPIESLTWKESLMLGSLQVLALIPGVSRSGATIMGGRIFRFPRAFLVEFSFLLAVPTIIAAGGYDLLKTSFLFAKDEFMLLFVGIAVSAIVAYLTVKYFLRYISTHTFAVFGWYRILIAGLMVLFML